MEISQPIIRLPDMPITQSKTSCIQYLACIMLNIIVEIHNLTGEVYEESVFNHCPFGPAYGHEGFSHADRHDTIRHRWSK